MWRRGIPKTRTSITKWPKRKYFINNLTQKIYKLAIGKTKQIVIIFFENVL